MAAIAVSIVSLGISVVQKARAAKAQGRANDEIKKQNRLAQRKADIRSARDRVNLVRKARVARAQVTAAAENAGAGQGSGVAGGIASLGSQVASNLGFVNQIGSINRSITASRNTQSDLLTQASKDQAIGGVADSIFGVAIQRTGTK